MNRIQVSGHTVRRHRMHPTSRRAVAGLQTSRRTTARSGTEWMDRERAFHRSLYPHVVRVEPDPKLRAMNRRRANLAQQVAALRERGRVPRACLYALVANEQVIMQSLKEVRAFAVRESWQIGTEQIFVDDTGPSHPATRRGWARVQQQVQSGFADGIVALTQAAVTQRRDEYETQLQWFAEHFGFIALVYPEIPAAQR